MSTPDYLRPYLRARQRGARGFDALLWEDEDAQEVRFEAIVRNCPMDGRSVLDVGCGPADLLGYLRARRIFPARYLGLEAQRQLVLAARARRYPRSEIQEVDFVREPDRLRIGAEVVVFSGSLNLFDTRAFHRTLRAAWAATTHRLVFNFLCSPALADAPFLRWHRLPAVLAFARTLTDSVRVDDSYEPGDCTMVLRK